MARREDRFDRRLIAPMLAGSILNPINSSMLAVALVPIGLALGAPPSQTAWLVSALYLATAIGQPVLGRLVDTLGPRGVFLTATLLVGAGGLLGGFAPSLPWLVAARVIIGVGTCAGYPSAMFLLRSEAARTGRDSPSGVLAILTVANQVVAVIGPTIGGLLIGIGGWRAIFFVNMPLSLACLALGAWLLPRGRKADDGGRRAGMVRSFDIPAMALFAGALGAAMLFAMNAGPQTWWALAAAVPLAAGFWVRELRATTPFIDLRTMAGNAPLIATYLRQWLTATTSYLMLYGFTQWLEAGRGLSPTHAGMMLLPMFATAIVVTLATGRRPELRAKLIVGSVALLAAAVLTLQIHANSATWFLVAIALLFGVPQGLLNLANQNAVYYQADPSRVASAAGLLRTFHYLGAIASAAITAALFGDHVTTAGTHVMAWVILGCATVLLVASSLDRSLGRH